MFLAGDRQIAIAVGAAHGDTRDELIDLATGRVPMLQTRSCGQPLRVNATTGSASGGLVAFAHSCGAIQVFNTTTAQKVGPPLPATSPAAIAMSPNGRLLAVDAGHGTVKVFDIATGATVAVLSQDLSPVTMLAFSPDGHYLAAGSLDATIHLWDARSFDRLRVNTAPARSRSSSSPPIPARSTRSMATTTSRPGTPAPTARIRTLLALARTRVTRSLTGPERREFSVG